MVQPAGTTYEDWVGSAAAEDSAIKGSGDLYELAGLDHGRWSILSVDIYAFSHGKTPDWHVSVYAVDTEANAIGGYADLKRLEAERGSIPVTHIALHNVSLEDVVRCMKVVHFQLIKPNFQRLDIVGRADFPVQE
jgi:hypothetical protein